MHRQRTIFYIIQVVLCVIGGSVIFYATRWGPWALSDGAGYIMNARSLRAGLGLTLPFTGGGAGHL